MKRNVKNNDCTVLKEVKKYWCVIININLQDLYISALIHAWLQPFQ